MSGQAHIDRLDRSLARTGEWVTLRRTVGNAPNQQNVDVSCRARVTSLSPEQQIIANIAQTDLNIILSPTQINAAQWPGGTPVPHSATVVDSRIPVVNSDKVVARGRTMNVKWVDAVIIEDTLVRINLRVG